VRGGLRGGAGVFDATKKDKCSYKRSLISMEETYKGTVIHQKRLKRDIPFRRGPRVRNTFLSLSLSLSDTHTLFPSRNKISLCSTERDASNPPNRETRSPRYKFILNPNFNSNLDREIPRNLSFWSW